MHKDQIQVELVNAPTLSPRIIAAFCSLLHVTRFIWNSKTKLPFLKSVGLSKNLVGPGRKTSTEKTLKADISARNIDS